MEAKKEKPFISCEPIKDGGLLLKGNTPHATYYIEFDQEAKLIKYDVSIKQSKAKTCFGCGNNKPLIVRQDYGPGDVVAKVVEAVTAGKVKMCPSCKSRRAILNKMGWKGILKNPIKAIGIFFKSKDKLK